MRSRSCAVCATGIDPVSATSRQPRCCSTSVWRRDAGWKAACILIDRPGLRPHDLRHTAATAWLRITGDLKAVQTLLGHSTASMTLDLYSHVLNDTLTRAADLMAQGLAALDAERPEDRHAIEDEGPAA